MSEYTRYFVAKNQTKREVQNILEEHKIYSIVSSEKRKKAVTEKPSWIVIAAPEFMSLKESFELSETGAWTKLQTLFDTVVALSIEEDRETAELKIAQKDQKPLRMGFGKSSTNISEEIVQRVAEVFEKSADTIKTAWYQGIQKFCKVVEIPYLELLDQNLLFSSIPSGNQHTYSFTDEELVQLEREVSIPSQADRASWVEISPYPFYGKDVNHVYFEGHIVPEADPATFRLEKAFGVDKNHVFYNGVIMPDVDVPTFTTQMPMHFAKDKNRVYYCAQILPDVDLETFEVFPDSAYAQDKNHIYFMNEILNDVDRETFKIASWQEASDKYGKFYYAKRVTRKLT
jgi:hypothetical protein